MNDFLLDGRDVGTLRLRKTKPEGVHAETDHPCSRCVIGHDCFSVRSASDHILEMWITPNPSRRTRNRRRLLRQFAALERRIPFLHRPIHILLQPRLRFVRPVIGVAFLLGGLLSFLPVFGIWMLPLGLLVLALDFPLIQPLVSSLFIRGRRGISRAWRQVKSWRRPDAERG